MTSTAVTAFAPVLEPVLPGRFARRCWHLIGPDLHPVAAEFRLRAAPPVFDHDGVPRSRHGTAVLLGREFGWEDNTRLLNGIAVARRDGGRLVLVHLGAGGGSVLKVAAKEDPCLDVLCIELPDNPSARAKRIAVTLANSDDLHSNDLRVDDAGRVSTVAWRPVELPPGTGSNGRAPGSILVTGGLGGLGVRAAQVLARVRGLHPVLLDSARPAGAARHLNRLRASRTGVTVLTADITDRRRIAAMLAGLTVPPVCAVVHCAGVLRGGPVSRFTSYDLAYAQRVKVDGLRNVLDSLESGALRHLITFGSIAAEEPHLDLGCYALANELLRRATLDAAKDLPDCATIAAEWSLWSGAGMAGQAGAVTQARRMGMTPVSLRAGMTALVRLFDWPMGPAAATPLVLSVP